MFKIDWSFGYKRPHLSWTLPDATLSKDAASRYLNPKNGNPTTVGVFSALKKSKEIARNFSFNDSDGVNVTTVATKSLIGSISDTYKTEVSNEGVPPYRENRIVFPEHPTIRNVAYARSKNVVSVKLDGGRARSTVSATTRLADGTYVHVGRTTIKKLAKLRSRWWNIRSMLAPKYEMGDLSLSNVSRLVALIDNQVPWSITKKDAVLRIHETTPAAAGVYALTELSASLDVDITLMRAGLSKASMFGRLYVDPPITHATQSFRTKVNLVKPIIPHDEDVRTFDRLCLEYRYGAAVADIIRFLDEHAMKWFYSRATGLMLTNEEDKTLALVSCGIVTEFETEVYPTA